MSTDTTAAPAPAALAGSEALKNARHEVFAQQWAAGLAKVDAYLEAYPHAAEWKPKAVHNKAWALTVRPDVAARFAYLQAMAADSAMFTRADHIHRLNALSITAEKKGEFAAAVKAEELRGRAGGYQSQKVELTGKNGGPMEYKQTRDLTDEEFDHELIRHGLEPRKARALDDRQGS